MFNRFALREHFPGEFGHKWLFSFWDPFHFETIMTCILYSCSFVFQAWTLFYKRFRPSNVPEYQCSYRFPDQSWTSNFSERFCLKRSKTVTERSSEPERINGRQERQGYIRTLQKQKNNCTYYKHHNKLLLIVFWSLFLSLLWNFYL